MKKKIALLLVLIVVLTAIFGCSKKEVPAPSSSSSSSESTQGQTETKTTPIDGAGIRILYWGYGMNVADLEKTLNGSLKLSYISGVDIYVEWKDIQPSEGKFDWSMFDKAIEVAKKYNKTVSIGLLVAAKSPQWVLDKSDTFTYEHIHPSVGVQTAPVPWSEGYKNALATAVTEMGKRYDNNPNVYYVVVNGPASLYGVETNWPMKAGTISAPDLKKLDFSLEKWAQGWKDSFDLFMTAFPNTKLSLALHYDIGYPGFSDVQKINSAKSIRDYAIDKYNTARNDKLMLALLGLHASNPKAFDAPYNPNKEVNAYASLLWDVKDKTIFNLESTQVWKNPNVGNTVGYDAAYIKKLIEIGISYRAESIKIKAPDVWDLKANTVYEPYFKSISDGADMMAEKIQERRAE